MGLELRGRCMTAERRSPAAAMRSPPVLQDLRRLRRKNRELLSRVHGYQPPQSPAEMDEDALDLRKKGLMPPAAALEDGVVETPYLSVTYDPPEPRRAGETAEGRALQQSRRLLANARERTRVHTISAAFEALRKQVPCYSYGQKLSKLAILRIACNYILSLAQLADLDYSADHSNLSFSECVEQCTRTLQSEGRSKKRKE